MAATLPETDLSVITRSDTARLDALAVVDSPISPTSSSALARFEFEIGKGSDGTKILMVEWDTTAAPPAASKPGEEESATTNKNSYSDWDVSWEGKSDVLQIRDLDLDRENLRRVYFLLPPGAAIPPIIAIKQRSRDFALRTKPLPAIFPVGLGAIAQPTGKRGVLHSIWANKRLSELDTEIQAERRENADSIELDIAIQERDWIKDYFGVQEDAASMPPKKITKTPQSTSPHSPVSPRSPVGGKLGEKLRGLKLATSPTELANATPSAGSNKSKVATAIAPTGAAVSAWSAMGPRHADGDAGVASLDAVVDSSQPAATAATATPDAARRESTADTEEELFALPMSPRSPEMTRSPFSML